jgi:hypothetical protein
MLSQKDTYMLFKVSIKVWVHRRTIVDGTRVRKGAFKKEIMRTKTGAAYIIVAATAMLESFNS